jgi:hypothetical protein
MSRSHLPRLTSVHLYKIKKGIEGMKYLEWGLVFVVGILFGMYIVHNDLRANCHVLGWNTSEQWLECPVSVSK